MAVTREFRAVCPGTHVGIGIGEENHTIAFLFQLAESSQLIGRHISRITQPAMAHFIKRQFSAHHLLQGLLIFFKTQFTFLQVAEDASLAIRVQNFISLLQPQCTETPHCFIMVECDDHAAHVKNHRFNHIILYLLIHYNVVRNYLATHCDLLFTKLFFYFPHQPHKVLP